MSKDFRFIMGAFMAVVPACVAVGYLLFLLTGWWGVGGMVATVAGLLLMLVSQ